MPNHDLWLGHYFAAAPDGSVRKDSRVRALFCGISLLGESSERFITLQPEILNGHEILCGGMSVIG
jgi:hypothetical protein